MIMNMNPNDCPQALEPNEPQKSNGYESISSFLFDVLEMVAWSVFAMVLIFTFTIRVCRVEGSSMENTLYHNQTLLVRSIGYEPKQDDIIVFHLTKPEIDMEKTLVKRVIATGGQKLVINFDTCEIYVDGVLYKDSHKVLKAPGGMVIDRYYSTGIYTVTVPQNTLFVMGDNRNNSNDSRNPAIGFIDERCVLGKVVMRLSPFEIFS